MSKSMTKIIILAGGVVLMIAAITVLCITSIDLRNI